MRTCVGVWMWVCMCTGAVVWVWVCVYMRTCMCVQVCSSGVECTCVNMSDIPFLSTRYIHTYVHSIDTYVHMYTV